MVTLLAKNMTPQAMKAYYQSGGTVSKIMEVTGRDYNSVMNALKSVNTKIVTGGHGRRNR